MLYLSRTARKARDIKRVIDWKKFTALVNENSSKRDFQIPYSIIRGWTRLIEGVYYDLIHKDPGPIHDEDRMDAEFDGSPYSRSRG